MLKELIGKTVNGLYSDREHESIVFDTNEGLIGYLAVGDCCSYSWIAHISGIENLIGHRVVSLEEKDSPNICEETNEIALYFVTLKTDRGYFDFEMRNQSNGYYGGYLEVINSDDINLETFDKVTQDF